MTFNRIVSRYQEDIHSELSKFFDLKIKKSLFKPTLKILKEYNLRKSKRIRPILVNIGYLAAGGKNKKEILKASLCVELIHSFFLIHDDIIDQDELRRGKPSLHAFYRERFDDEHLGISLALAAGDVSNVLGYQALLESDFPIERKLNALKILNEMVERTCHGEMLELFLRKKIGEKDILEVLKSKTAYYTFVRPLQIGAVLAGGKDMEMLEKIALPLGMAFQIQDDILGIFSSQKKLGKPIASDIREGRPNLLIFKAASKELKKYLGKKDLTRKDIGEIREIIKQSGALEYCQDKTEKLVEQAQLLIQEFKMEKEAREFLLNLAEYIIQRKC